ncbi:MAG: DNA polymerase III subunit gamma/tau, partial [Actinobacteria bacterium]|nr:DNA polymerase III subunit gamma/tau [Actinomycetota bacterium]
MAFQSLYRKYRPQRFDALVGQDPVTTALRNAVREQRVGHAYLLSGPRGTGKTTSARILAKALNCLDLGADGEPCDACINCTGISAGTFTDLIELDAASNRGVQEARDLVSRINLGLGAGSSRKVYILDEVHMLTTEASNTLLKTLEEPPDHVVFVLATTDPQKVLPTIRSRTQHFEFSLLSVQDLSAHLAHILDLEAVEYEDEALEIVARAAAGSARDALSLLDQALAHSDGRVTAEQVRSAFGGSPFAQRLAVLDAVASEDTAGVLVCNAALLASGHDPRRIAEDLLRTLRDTFLLIAGGGRVEVDPPLEEQAQLKVVGAALGTAQMVRALETLGQAIIDMRGSEAADPRLVLEVALVRLARRDTGTPLQALSDRLERLERAVGEGRSISAAPSGDEGREKAAAPRAAAPQAPPVPKTAQVT